MVNVKHALLALAVVAALPRIAAADGKLKVAVVPGIAVNLDAARVDALSQELAGALMEELDITAIGGLEVRRSLPPDGIPPDCIATPSCVQDVAKRVGATQLLFVVMVDTGTGGAIQVDSTWLEPASGKSASRPAIDIASLPEAHARFAAAATSLLPDAPVKPKPKTGGGGPAGTMMPAVPRHFTTVSKVTAGVGGVALVAGVVMGIRTRSKYNDCDDDIVHCTQSNRDSIRANGLIADGAFVVAIGCAVATTVMFVTSGKEEHLVVTPAAEGTGGVASWIGRF